MKFTYIIPLVLTGALVFAVIDGHRVAVQTMERNKQLLQVEATCARVFDAETVAERAQCGAAQVAANAEYICYGDYVTQCYAEAK